MTEDLLERPRSLLEKEWIDNRSRLLSFLRHAGAGDHAEDLLQDAWLRLNNVADHGCQIADPLSYIFRLLHNLVLDWRRSEARMLRRNHSWADLTGPSRANISDAPDGERVLIARTHLAAVQRELDKLGEPTAAIFRRHRIGGMTQRAIADELGMGLSTVEKHLRKAYRAMLDLAETMDDD